MQRTGEAISISQIHYQLRAKRHSKISVIGFCFQYCSNTNRLTQCQDNTVLHCCRQERDLVHSTLKRKTKLLCTPYAILTTPSKYWASSLTGITRQKKSFTSLQTCKITSVNIFVLQAYFFVHSCHFLILL